MATGTRPSRRASNAMTRSRSAGQTNRPSRSNGATRTSPTASPCSSSRSTFAADGRRAPRRAADPEQRDIEAVPQVEHGLDARVRDERPFRGARRRRGPGAIRPCGWRAERLGDAAVRLALRAGRPVAAAQRHDRGRDRAWPPPRARRRSPTTEAPSPIPTIAPVADDGRAGPARRAGRPSAGSGPRGRRSSARGGPHRARSCARSASPAGLSAVVESMIRISTMPSARARLSRRETCGRVTPSCSAIAFCVSPSS